MGKIAVLDPSVAERIAAGEVIERPSSVVKELVENALDANATEVTVLLEKGGRNLIEVIDNGHGMPPEDLKICTQRHATSKVRELVDLENLSTLGFRGEALPSIGAVSDFSIISKTENTKPHEFKSGTVKEVTFGHFLGKDHGTRIRARGLFSQIPARLKFMKAQATEVSQVREWLERLSLTHPDVGFKLNSDERTVLNLRPQKIADRVRSVLAPGSDYPMKIAVNSAPEEPGIEVKVFWLQGFSSPQTRKLVQAVNGRALRDKFLQSAIMTPFRQNLLPGQFPGVALFIQLSPDQIDVNVHPTKTEIRFINNRIIFKEIRNTINAMLREHGAPAFASAPTQYHAPSTDMPRISNWRASASQFDFQPKFDQTRDQGSAGEIKTSSEMQSPHILSQAKYIGPAFQTYLLFDMGEELGMVDQHAADERIRYEKLRTKVLDQKTKPPEQPLLLPEAIHVDSERLSTLDTRLVWLERLGFEAETFGDDAVIFRSIPANWGVSNLKTRLTNLLERLWDYSPKENPETLFFDEDLFEKLASEACHSSVRAGDHLESVEASSLVNSLFRCEHPWNCPHGRPTFVKVPKGRLEEWFQRRVK